MIRKLTILLIASVCASPSLAAVVRTTILPNTTYFETDGITDPLDLAGGDVAVTGNIIEIGVLNNGFGNIVSITDAGGTDYVVEVNQVGDQGRIEVWWGFVEANNAGQDIVITLSGASNDGVQIIVREIGGVSADQSGILSNSSAQSASTSLSSGSVTPTNATGTMTGLAKRSNRTYTEDANFTENDSGSNLRYFGYIDNPPTSAEALDYTSTDGNADSLTGVVWYVGTGGSGSSPVSKIIQQH